MTFKQHRLILDLLAKLCDLISYTKRIQSQLRELCESFNSIDNSNQDEFTEDEVNRLICLNEKLAKLERYLCYFAENECPQLDARVADQLDQMDDYEIEATLLFMLGNDDSGYDEDGDNDLTRRQISLKLLNSVPHCWLFYDLYENSHGFAQPALSLHDCLRIGSIWVDIAVYYQSTLNI